MCCAVRAGFEKRGLLLAGAEGGFEGVEHGEGEVVFQGEDAQEYDRCGAADLLGYGAASAHEDYPVDERSRKAGGGINVLAKHQGLFVDEDVAQHSAEGAGDYAHHCGYPHGIAGGEGFLDADHAEQGEAYAVEDEEYAVAAHKEAAEHYDGDERQRRDSEIPPGLHPEHRYVEQHVAQCAAANGSDESNGVCPEPVKAFGRGEPYAAYRRGNGAYHFDNEKECGCFHCRGL